MRLRPSLVHHEVAVPEETAVQHLHGLGCFFLGRHLDEAKASRPSSELIGDDPHRFHCARLGEQLTQILFGGDYPFVPIAETAVGMTKVGLSAADLQAIGRDNAARLLPRFKA